MSKFQKLVNYSFAGFVTLCGLHVLNWKAQQIWVKKKHIKWYGDEYIGSVSFDYNDRLLLTSTIHKSPSGNSYVSFDQFGDMMIHNRGSVKLLYRDGNTYIYRMWDQSDIEQKTIFQEQLDGDGTPYPSQSTHQPTGWINF